MYYIVNEEELKRYAVITWEDTILCDSDILGDCEYIYSLFEGFVKGIYDFKMDIYLNEGFN